MGGCYAAALEIRAHSRNRHLPVPQQRKRAESQQPVAFYREIKR